MYIAFLATIGLLLFIIIRCLFLLEMHADLCELRGLFRRLPLLLVVGHRCLVFELTVFFLFLVLFFAGCQLANSSAAELRLLSLLDLNQLKVFPNHYITHILPNSCLARAYVFGLCSVFGWPLRFGFGLPCNCNRSPFCLWRFLSFSFCLRVSHRWPMWPFVALGARSLALNLIILMERREDAGAAADKCTRSNCFSSSYGCIFVPFEVHVRIMGDSVRTQNQAGMHFSLLPN